MSALDPVELDESGFVDGVDVFDAAAWLEPADSRSGSLANVLTGIGFGGGPCPLLRLLGKALGAAEALITLAEGIVSQLTASLFVPKLELEDEELVGPGLDFFGTAGVSAGAAGVEAGPAGQAPTTPGLKMPSSGGGPPRGSTPEVTCI